MKFDFNIDVDKRDEILFGDKYDRDKYFCGTRQFNDLDVDSLTKLVELRYIDLAEHQNESPTVAEILDFMQKHPLFQCHGYAVELERSDYRVSIEGVRRNGAVTMEMLVDFLSLFNGADKMVVSDDYLYCWYD